MTGRQRDARPTQDLEGFTGYCVQSGFYLQPGGAWTNGNEVYFDPRQSQPDTIHSVVVQDTTPRQWDRTTTSAFEGTLPAGCSVNPLTAKSERPYHCRSRRGSPIRIQGDWQRPKWTHLCVPEDGNVDYVVSDFTR